MKRNNILRIWLPVIWIIFFVTSWQYISAPIHDDIPYSRVVNDEPEEAFWGCKGKRITSWDDVRFSIVNHYKHINGRLTNLIMIILVPLPNFFSSLIVGVCAGLMFLLSILSIEVCASRKMLSAIVLIMALFWWKWFPWLNNMVSMDYALNYLPPSVTVLWYFLEFFRKPKKSESSAHMIYGILAGLFTGLLHEGFGIPLLVASAIFIFLFKERRKSRLFFSMAILIGLCISVLTPSTLNRISNHITANGLVFDLGVIFSVLRSISLSIFIGAITTIGISIFLLKRKNIASSIFVKKLLFWVIIAVTSIGIGVTLQGGGRYVWLASLGLLIYSFAIIVRLINIPIKVNHLISIIFCIICLIWSILFIGVTRKVSKNQYALIQAITESQNGVVYFDMIRSKDIPWWCWGMIHQYKPITLLWGIAKDYSPNRHPLILPTKYKAKHFEEWSKLPGNNPYRGFDCFWYSKSKVEAGTEFEVMLGDPTNAKVPFLPTPYKTIAITGDSYYSLDERGDTLWISSIELNEGREIMRMDYIKEG